VKPEGAHSTPEKFVEAMKSNHPAVAPSMLYAWASVTSGVPYANGSPNLSVDIPAIQRLAHDHNVAICGKDFKTGQTLIKTVLAPAFKARMLGLDGWFSTNILGNRDGEVLEDPGSFKTKEESKLSVLEYILQPQLYPQLYGKMHHKVRINYYPPRGDNKEGWITSTFSAGSATPCKSRWTSFAAIPFWPRRSYSTSSCSWTSPSARECAAFRSGSASTSSRQ